MQTTLSLSTSNRLRATPYTSRVLDHGAAAFTVYNHMLLPTEFSGLVEDYWHLCKYVQVWDVGVERQVSFAGRDATRLVQWMTPRNIAKIVAGQCVYVPLADERGRLINDPIALRINENHWWLSIADSDVLLWAKGLAQGAGMDVQIHEPDVWPLAVQGPRAEDLMSRVFGDVSSIRFFRFEPRAFAGHEFLIARSGWSKQGGFEIYVDDAETGVALYDALFEQGKDLHVGPGCPNLIERMEGGLLSYGNDMTMQHSPLEAGLDSFFKLDPATEAMCMPALLAEQTQGLQRKLMSLVLPAPDGPLPLSSKPFVPAGGASSTGIGRLGSQAWSPRYAHQIATVMLEKPFYDDKAIEVQLLDGHLASARILPMPINFSAAAIMAVQE